VQGSAGGWPFWQTALKWHAAWFNGWPLRVGEKAGGETSANLHRRRQWIFNFYFSRG